ncbi:hypothetical protein [Novosphingobium sp. 9]|uniref:hypothetical protein n=1 Tax=Novosphingobium sp. 9 TaxID=2025349 RepID=UPI0021B5169B|nr:hypothetical protein [Novosphingobium sp. 9]
MVKKQNIQGLLNGTRSDRLRLWDKTVQLGYGATRLTGMTLKQRWWMRAHHSSVPERWGLM